MSSASQIGRGDRRSIVQSYERALDWVRVNTLPERGVIVSSTKRVPYLEVTGYLIPTLIDAGEYNLAERYSDFLQYMQRPDGSFAGPDGNVYFFDTAQVLRGLTKAAERWGRFRPVAEKTANYLESCIDQDGIIQNPYGGDIPQAVHIYGLPALMEASRLLSKKNLEDAAMRALTYYKGIPEVKDTSHLTHFLSYILDGLIEMGERDFAEPMIKKVFSRQNKNGSIPAYPNVRWVCSTGMAQLAIIAYKTGRIEQGDRALAYLSSLQNRTGGFNGSYGWGRKYFPDEEIGWANKFYLDAVKIKIEAFFDHHANIFPTEVAQDDGRLRAILDHAPDLSNKKVLDAGCGKGRFASRIREKYPSAEIHGLDISQALLTEAPSWLIKKQGSLLSLPYPSGTFDMIICVEALEHTVRIQKGIEELCRVLKDGGHLVIIDKNVAKLGKMEITDFEQWFDLDEVVAVLKEHCRNVKADFVSYDANKADGVFIAWSGVKGISGLGPDGWHKAMTSSANVLTIVERIRSNQYPVWMEKLLEFTSEGDSLLELGSGTGELSAILATYKRKTTLLDFSKESIESSRMLFKELKLECKLVHQDLLKGIPMPDRSVDWVWSSGLLEHFTDTELEYIMRESMRVCRKGVISLVPNATSLPYRVGKMSQERNGKWTYGIELPKSTLKSLFAHAGLSRIVEGTVGTYHSLEFMENGKADWKAFLDSLSPEELHNLHQGYLLYTVGYRPEHHHDKLRG